MTVADGEAGPEGYVPLFLTGQDRVRLVEARLRRCEAEWFDHELAVVEAEGARDVVSAARFQQWTAPHLKQIKVCRARCEALRRLRDDLTL